MCDWSNSYINGAIGTIGSLAACVIFGVKELEMLRLCKRCGDPQLRSGADRKVGGMYGGRHRPRYDRDDVGFMPNFPQASWPGPRFKVTIHAL